MPSPAVRPEVPLLITALNLDRHEDPSRCYHLDRRPFTAAEHELLSTMTPAEIAAAKA